MSLNLTTILLCVVYVSCGMPMPAIARDPRFSSHKTETKISLEQIHFFLRDLWLQSHCHVNPEKRKSNEKIARKTAPKNSQEISNPTDNLFGGYAKRIGLF